MKTIKPYLFTLLSLFLTSTVILSCSNENIETKDLNASQITLEPQTLETPTIENPKEVIPVKPYSLEENVNKFSIEYLTISNRMVAIFKENKKRVLDPSIKLKINSAKNLNQVFSILNNSKTVNNEELISLIIKKMKLTTDFIKENKSLRKLTKLQIENMLSEAFFKARAQSKTVKLTSKTAMGGECLQDFNNNVDRSYNTANNENITAFGGLIICEASTGGVGSAACLAGYAVTVYGIEAEYGDQITYAIQEYENCTITNCSKIKRPVKY
jgi:hypothetical protein